MQRTMTEEEAMAIFRTWAIWSLVYSAAFGIASAAVASSKGRSGPLWFILGFILGCIGLVVILCLPSVGLASTYGRGSKGGSKRGGFGGGTQARTSGSRPSIRSPGVDASRFAAAQWYVATNDAREGPISFEEMKSRWNRNRLAATTLVWFDGMEDWAQIKAVPGLAKALGA
jgi:hypothetical protein